MLVKIVFVTQLKTEQETKTKQKAAFLCAHLPFR